MAEALFVVNRDGSLTPTELARGPWDPLHLHGGPVALLLARAVEGQPDGGEPLELARLTFEILRPVPLEPLAIEVEVVRPGRKVQLVEATLTHRDSGRPLAKVRALRIRNSGVELPTGHPVTGPLLRAEAAPDGPDGIAADEGRDPDVVAFHNHAVEHRFVEGSWAEPGPVTVWMRLVTDVVAGEAPSPVQRVVAAADFGNGVARVLEFETHLFINPDLTVHLSRPPVGEWVAMRAKSHIGPFGAGMAESELFDRGGRIGRSVQSLLIDVR
jgi:hypothetical protein